MSRPEHGAWIPDGELRVLAVPGVPDLRAGDDLGALVLDAVRASGLALLPWDVIAVTQKAVSKVEGRTVSLAGVEPSERALALAPGLRRSDPRHIELVLRESARVIREAGILICQTHGGLVCANAGVDLSNAAGEETATLLPLDPDASAARLRTAWLGAAGGGPLGVVVTDTFGRPFRLHGVNVAIGVAGMPALTTYTGGVDATGYELLDSQIGSADEIASAAELVMGKLDAVPVAILRGLRWAGEDTAAELLRDPASDMFRS